ncbi:putative Ig domain-containing protein, partial [Microcystis sp.]|uniref:putative Ig domain-containing protein n=1 Tax=Microcystis sp. TaxID=1127 RepID=UPI00391A74E7
IIDTGADLNHPLFGADANNNGIADKIIYQYDFADNDADASDKNNHGSHITSIASQIAPDANLIILKVFKDDGSGYFADLEEALQWVNTNANTYNVASVNLSLGDNQNWTTQASRYGIGDELAAIAGQNILIAAAAGNSFYTFNSTPGLAYPAADPNVISVGAVWADDFGSRSFSNGAVDYTTFEDAIASFSQRHPLLDVFAPGILITGANATGGTISMGGTSQATPFISAIATLSQQIAQTYLGREITLTEFRTLLDTTSNLIIDGDNEQDNVINTGISYPRINVLALAEGILNLSNISSGSNTGNTGNNSGNDPIYVPDNTVSLVHTITLTAGQILTDINFGNQLLPTNQAPIVSNISKTGNEDNILTFTLADFTSAFSDPDNNSLTKIQITSLPNNGVLKVSNTAIALDQEINATDLNNLVFTPNSNFNGNISFSWNGYDGTVYAANPATVNLTINSVNDAPTVENAIADQTATEDTPFSFQIPDNTFADIDTGDTLNYSATLANDNPLPNWLNFNQTNRTFSGTPTNNDVGNLSLKVTATDSVGESVSTSFAIAITNTNDAPTVENAIADQTATEDTPFSFQIPNNTFADIDTGDTLTYSATLSNGNPLPNWLNFNQTNRTFSGTPTNNDVGNLSLKVTATDSVGESVSDSFSLTIVNDDTGVTSQLSINDITVVEGKDNHAILTVTVHNPNPQQITVNYTTTPIDATANVDYTSQTGTLTIAANTATATISIPILNDNLNEPDEVFTVTLSNPVNATINPDEAIGQVIITDTLQSAITRTLPNNVENLRLIGTNNINGTGNAGNNNITGNSGINQINGGAGIDTLTGGLGADTFIFQFGQSTISASDRITDFAINSDKIDLLTQGGTATSAPSNFSRAANSTVTTLQNLVNQVFTDANGATTGNQELAVNSAALVQVTTGAIAGTYLVINDSAAGFQSSNDLLINITGFTGTLPALGNIPEGNFFV